jgi:hypothetical protein
MRHVHLGMGGLVDPEIPRRAVLQKKIASGYAVTQELVAGMRARANSERLVNWFPNLSPSTQLLVESFLAVSPPASRCLIQCNFRDAVVWSERC